MGQKIMSIICWCYHPSTKLGDLSSAASVGIGLFLALAVVQVLGAGGVARLRRKAVYLRELVSTNGLQAQKSAVARVDAELLRLELSLEGLSKLLFSVSFALVFVALVGLGVMSLAPKVLLNCAWIAGLLGFYLGLPIAIFLVASSVIHRKCSNVREKVQECQKEVLDCLNNGV